MAPVGESPNGGGEEEPYLTIRAVNLVDLGRSLVVHATAARHVPHVFTETIYRWDPDGLFGVGAFPTDKSGECGPILGLCLASDPLIFNKDQARRVRVKFWWTSGAFKRDASTALATELFEAFFARVPNWVSHVTTWVDETNQDAIQQCVACRMRAVKTIHKEDEPDTLVFSRPVMRELNR